jgi:hypothetical protein
MPNMCHNISDILGPRFVSYESKYKVYIEVLMTCSASRVDQYTVLLFP